MLSWYTLLVICREPALPPLRHQSRVSVWLEDRKYSGSSLLGGVEGE